MSEILENTNLGQCNRKDPLTMIRDYISTSVCVLIVSLSLSTPAQAQDDGYSEKCGPVKNPAIFYSEVLDYHNRYRANRNQCIEGLDPMFRIKTDLKRLYGLDLNDSGAISSAGNYADYNVRYQDGEIFHTDQVIKFVDRDLRNTQITYESGDFIIFPHSGEQRGIIKKFTIQSQRSHDSLIFTPLPFFGPHIKGGSHEGPGGSLF